MTALHSVPGAVLGQVRALPPMIIFRVRSAALVIARCHVSALATVVLYTSVLPVSSLVFIAATDTGREAG